MTQTNEKTRKSKKTLFLMVFFLSFLTFAIVLNNQAYPEDEGDPSCHGGGYLIAVEDSEMAKFITYDMTAERGDTFDISVKGTGPAVLLNISVNLKDNDDFEVLPARFIADNSVNDTNPAVDTIEVILTVTVPLIDDIYNLRILAKQPTDSPGTEDALAVADIRITVGEVFVPLINRIFSSSYLYLDGFSLFISMLGLLALLINIRQDSDSRVPGVIMALALLSMSVNIYFNMSKADDSWMTLIRDNYDKVILFNPFSIDLDLLSQFITVAFSIIAYITAIIVVFGGVNRAPSRKLKVPMAITVLLLLFNFMHGFMFLGPVGGF